VRLERLTAPDIRLCRRESRPYIYFEKFHPFWNPLASTFFWGRFRCAFLGNEANKGSARQQDYPGNWRKWHFWRHQSIRWDKKQNSIMEIKCLWQNFCVIFSPIRHILFISRKPFGKWKVAFRGSWKVERLFATLSLIVVKSIRKVDMSVHLCFAPPFTIVSRHKFTKTQTFAHRAFTTVGSTTTRSATTNK
jgi:hypothetical protein